MLFFDLQILNMYLCHNNELKKNMILKTAAFGGHIFLDLFFAWESLAWTATESKSKRCYERLFEKKYYFLFPD